MPTNISKGEQNVVLTKQFIFSVFYSKKDVVRKGGGKLKTKMTRNSVGVNKLKNIEKQLNGHDNEKLVKYFYKLKDRRKGIAPPPCPKN